MIRIGNRGVNVAVNRGLEGGHNVELRGEESASKNSSEERKEERREEGLEPASIDIAGNLHGEELPEKGTEE